MSVYCLLSWVTNDIFKHIHNYYIWLWLWNWELYEYHLFLLFIYLLCWKLIIYKLSQKSLFMINRRLFWRSEKFCQFCLVYEIFWKKNFSRFFSRFFFHILGKSGCFQISSFEKNPKRIPVDKFFWQGLNKFLLNEFSVSP